MAMATDKLKKIIDLLSEDDIKGISQQNIQEWGVSNDKTDEEILANIDI